MCPKFMAQLCAYSILCVFLCTVLATDSAFAQDSDTLSYYHSKSGYVYFRDPAITLQAARFVNPAPSYVTEISVALGGTSSNGTARLRLFGHEGGVPVPVMEDDLIEPILLRKSRKGFERITVSIPERPFLANNQFFVALDQIDSGVVVLSDKKEREPFCVSDADEFYFQALKQADSTWKWEKYAFAIDVVMDYPESLPQFGLGEVSASLGILDTLQFNRSIAWGDLDNNGFLDLLWDGRVYLNREGKSFELVNETLGIKGLPAANLFLDANSDGLLDILFLSLKDDEESSVLFINVGSREFQRKKLATPAINFPGSFSLADVNGDGFLDLFVGSSADALNSHLFLSLQGQDFVDASDNIVMDSHGSLSNVSGSQFVDIDNDGDPDLYVARNYPEHSLILYNNGAGLFNSYEQSVNGPGLHNLGSGSGGDWKDFDNDGDPDLLYPRLIHPYLHKYSAEDGSGIYVSEHDGVGRDIERSGVQGAVDYEERHAGGVWGDVDNNGLLDAFFTTSGDCRFAELYTQDKEYVFKLSSFDFGLHWSSAGHDAVWVDFNNDGWLDLCAIEWGRIRIYENPGDGGHHGFIEIDPVIENGTSDVGASVIVHAGNLRLKRTVTVGRGVLMADPSRLHYGLGLEKNIDSVEVLWSDGLREVFTDIAANSIAQIKKGSSGEFVSASSASISAVPNPFSDQLHIHYRIPSTQHVRLEVFNQAGALVNVLLDQSIEGGEHKVVWNADDQLGVKVPTGIYIYRLTLDGGELSGRAVLTR